MLVTAVFAAVLVAVAPGGGRAGQRRVAPAATGRVDVVMTFGGQPVGRAMLVNNDASNPNPVNNFDGTNFTAADGRYAVAVPGDYDVHVAEYPGNNVLYGSQVVYEVAVPDGGRADLAFELDQPTGAITGQVRQPRRHPGGERPDRRLRHRRPR